MPKSKQLGFKELTVKMDKDTLARVDALVALRSSDSRSSLIRALVNEEYLSNEADIIERGYLFPAAPKEGDPT